MKRPNMGALNAPFHTGRTQRRTCQHPGCREPGEYRAPAARERLDDYLWFCLEHVREYNLAWDYFAGMSEDDIERQRRWDTVWQRPSWPLGQMGERANFGAHSHLHDDFGFFSGDPGQARPTAPQTEEQKALGVLGLEQPVTFDDVKSRYKMLVKQLHPDANGADADAEERLKAVNQAYAALKISFA